MRKVCCFLILLVTCGCGDDDPKKYSSINGYWIVRTPDNATDVTFRIGQNADKEFIIESVLVNHNGADYNTEPVDSQIIVTSPTEIESITFRANSFVIRFLTITVNSEFTEMEITNSSVRIDQDFREFEMMKATRE
jgi:hypothetical protein